MAFTSYFVKIWDCVEDGMSVSLGRVKDHMWVRAKAVLGEEEESRKWRYRYGNMVT